MATAAKSKWESGIHRHAGPFCPSVVSINGVVASLTTTEFMKWRTGLGAPARLLRYDGASGKVTLSADKPRPDCWYCHGVRGQGARADVERYLRQPALS